MKVIWKLIRLHKCLFSLAMFFTCLLVGMELGWNRFLAYFINRFSSAGSFSEALGGLSVTGFALSVFLLIFAIGLCDLASSFFANYTCEYFAHEMRMGYVRNYLQTDRGALAKMNVGEEQSAMQNELGEISTYLNENLFALAKQFLSFVLTVLFLSQMNLKLTMLSVLPVFPVIWYCAFASKNIRELTFLCQESKKKINGLSGIFIDLFPIIQVYDAYQLYEKVQEERLREWQDANVKKERIAAKLMSLSGFFSFLPLLVLLWCGGRMVVRGEITLGVFYIFINLSGNVSGFLQNMPNIYARFRGFSAAVGRLKNRLVLEKRKAKKSEG